MLLPPLEVGGEHVLDHNKPDPIQGRLHCLLGQPDGLQQFFFSGKQEIHCGGHIRQKKCIFESLGLTADQPSEHYGGGENVKFEASSPTFPQGPVSHVEC